MRLCLLGADKIEELRTDKERKDEAFLWVSVLEERKEPQN